MSTTDCQIFFNTIYPLLLGKAVPKYKQSDCCSSTSYTLTCTNNRLTKIDLSNNQLSGSIPPSISNLQSLEYLWLHQNRLSGTIPTEIGSIKSLKEIFVQQNDLTGTIPESIGTLTNLQGLALSTNKFTGTIPTSIWKLTQLTQIWLYKNQFTGNIPPEIGSLTNLKILGVFETQISGSIPSQIGNLINLQYMRLYENKLNGPIPPEIGSLTNLKELDLHSNEISGSIPVSIRKLTNLQKLWLYHNELSGPIPSEIGQLLLLQELDLSQNQLNNDIPIEIQSLPNYNSKNFTFLPQYLPNTKPTNSKPTTIVDGNVPVDSFNVWPIVLGFVVLLLICSSGLGFYSFRYRKWCFQTHKQNMLTQQKSRDTIVDDSATRRNSELNHGQNNESGTFVYKNQDQSVSNRSYGTRSPLNTETNRSYPDHFESHNHSNIIHSRSNTQFDSNNNNSHFNPNNTSYSHRSHSQSDHYHSNPDTLLNSSLSPTYNLDPTKDTVIPVSTMYDVRLQITKKIAGSGGEGTVYLAIYDGKKAVAKIPTNQNHQKDVFYESQMMSTLRCPWVVESLAFMSDAMIQIPNQPDLRRTALIIEFMNLGALSKYLIPQPPLQKETEYHLVNNITLKLMKDVTKGMEFIHQLSYIHLDIKPDNVLLCQQGDGVIAKLSDFGSCRRNGTQDQVYQTKGYIPPEIRISPIKTEKYDIYAFGCILINVLTLSTVNVWWGYDKTLMDKEKYLNSYIKNIEIVELIMKCIHDIPTERPTATQILQSLNQFTQQDFKSILPTVEESHIPICSEIGSSTIKSSSRPYRLTPGEYLFQKLQLTSPTSWLEFQTNFQLTFVPNLDFNFNKLKMLIHPKANQVSARLISQTILDCITPLGFDDDESIWVDSILDAIDELIIDCTKAS